MKAITGLLALTVALAACTTTSDLEGSGEVVTETRVVEAFTAVEVDNGPSVTLTVDPTATGSVELAVTTDANLLEALSTEVSGETLKVTIDRGGELSSTQGFDVVATVAALEEVDVNNGGNVTVAGTVDELTLSANNGGNFRGDGLEATTADVDVNNGGNATVCASEEVTGAVRNGGNLTVLCGGDTSGIDVSDGGNLSSR